MTSERFAAGKWIDSLARGLRNLSKTQEPYLQQYYRENPRVHVLYDGRGSDEPAFPLDDLRDLYALALHGKIFGKEEHYAPLCAVLDPVRRILRSHPTLARVTSPIIGRDEFWMEILNTGNSTSLGDLVAGLMARAAELSGDCFRTAVGEMNALLTPAAEGESPGVQGGLDVGYRGVLFYGLTLKERINVVDSMVLLPFEQVLGLVDKSLVEELAPPRQRVPRLAVGWGSGQTVSVEASVPPNRLWRGAETGKPETVFPGRGDLSGTSCRGPRGACAVSCNVGPLHRPVRWPPPGTGGSSR